jgi:integrase/recombinase XerD
MGDMSLLTLENRSMTETGGDGANRGRLRPGISLVGAAGHYRRELERQQRPRNTIDSYLYDITVLAHQIPTKSLNQITPADLGRFLEEAQSLATRKRRLTSLRRFFRFLVDEENVLGINPTAEFIPNKVELRTPQPLTTGEQDALLAAAEADEPWTLTAIWLMLRLGLARAEILHLERGGIDRSTPFAPAVRIESDDPSKPNKNRTLTADARFAEIYGTFLDRREPEGRLFPVGFQAINGMVDRVRKSAEISRPVTPRLLRETYAADRARAGASEDDLIAELGLADDLRNRQSVRRFLAFAQPSAESS